MFDELRRMVGATALARLGAGSLRSWATGEWRLAQREKKDFAHLATRYDRPSSGFNPCEPSDVRPAPEGDARPPARD